MLFVGPPERALARGSAALTPDTYAEIAVDIWRREDFLLHVFQCLPAGGPTTFLRASVAKPASNPLPPPRHPSLPVSRTRKTITENIGRAVDPTPTSWVFEEEMACCRRMLDRGPAFRARSFAWSSHVIAAAEGDPPSSEVVVSEKLKPADSLDVRVFRPMGTRFFAELFARFVRGCFGFWFCSWRSTRICVGSVSVGPLRRSSNTFEVSSYIDWAE